MVGFLDGVQGFGSLVLKFLFLSGCLNALPGHAEDGYMNTSRGSGLQALGLVMLRP